MSGDVMDINFVLIDTKQQSDLRFSFEALDLFS